MAEAVAYSLLEHFKSAFVSGLYQRKEVVIDALKRAHHVGLDSSSPPTLIINLGKLFDAICLSAQSHQIFVEFKDWNKTFKIFCHLLMERWPDEAMASSGYRLKLIRRSNSFVSKVIALSPLNQVENQIHTG